MRRDTVKPLYRVTCNPTGESYGVDAHMDVFSMGAATAAVRLFSERYLATALVGKGMIAIHDDPGDSYRSEMVGTWRRTENGWEQTWPPEDRRNKRPDSSEVSEIELAMAREVYDRVVEAGYEFLETPWGRELVKNNRGSDGVYLRDLDDLEFVQTDRDDDSTSFILPLRFLTDREAYMKESQAAWDEQQRGDAEADQTLAETNRRLRIAWLREELADLEGADDDT